MRTKKNSEIPMVPKMHLKNVEHQRDRYKVENEKLKEQIDISQVSRLIAENEKVRERNKELEKRCNQKVRRYLRGGLQQMRIVDLEHKYNDMKTERDTLIDDLKVLREKSEQLKENNEQLNEIFNYQEKKKKEYFNEIVKLEKENKALRLQANTYFDEWQNVKKLYTTLTERIRLKASANPGVDRYIALVNFIDRLEQK